MTEAVTVMAKNACGETMGCFRYEKLLNVVYSPYIHFINLIELHYSVDIDATIFPKHFESYR